jgi:hypothetical protein
MPLVYPVDGFVNKSKHGRKFIPGLLVEIGIAHAAVQRAVAEADVREVGGAVQADGNVATPCNC